MQPYQDCRILFGSGYNLMTLALNLYVDVGTSPNPSNGIKNLNFQSCLPIPYRLDIRSLWTIEKAAGFVNETNGFNLVTGVGF